MHYGNRQEIVCDDMNCKLLLNLLVSKEKLLCCKIFPFEDCFLLNKSDAAKKSSRKNYSKYLKVDLF